MNAQAIDQKSSVDSRVYYRTRKERKADLAGGIGDLLGQIRSGALMRIPTFYLVPPASGEIRQMFWGGRAAVVSYLWDRNESYPDNAWLYIGNDRAYGLNKLAPTVRRNVGRGFKQLKIMPIASDQRLRFA
jgi:hypothetical protein